jgi:flagellar motor protein MotB
LKSKREATEETGPKVPGYIVTFSDMVTLLLTFFVMLLSLASVQDPELFNMGRGSFIQSIRDKGLGTLWGRKQRPDFGHQKARYFVSKPEESFAGRGIDARDEKVRRVFKRVNHSMTTMPSQIVAERVNFAVTNIHFPSGDAVLVESDKRFLREFCLNLQTDFGSKTGALYVLGLASEAPIQKEQWMLSARRSRAVADFLRNNLHAGTEASVDPLQWSIYWWGAGAGGNWVEKDSLISKQSQILIAVLTTED